MNILILLNILLASVAFIKDILLARYFGTSYYADSLYLAFSFPDLVGNSLLAAAIGITCVPVFTGCSKDKIKEHFEQLVNKVLLFTFILSLCLLLVLLPSAKWFLSYFSFKMFPGEPNITFHYFLIMLPIVILSPISIIATSLMQVTGQFIKPATIPVIFNLVLLFSVLVCILFEYPLFKGGYFFASTLLLSTVLVSFLSWLFVIQIEDISFRSIFHPIALFKTNNDEIYLFLKLLLPYFCILLGQQIIFLVERFYASTLEVGTISGLTYAFRISQFPIWVFIAAINTVLLPTISKLKDHQNYSKLKKELTKSFFLVLITSSSISILFFLFGDQLIAIMFLQGAFDQNSWKITSDILSGFALSITGQSVFLFCLRYFIAIRKMKIPFLISVISCFFHIILIYFLVPNIGAEGIGYAAAIGYSLTGAFILVFLYRDLLVWEKKGGQQHYE